MILCPLKSVSGNLLLYIGTLLVSCGADEFFITIVPSVSVKMFFLMIGKMKNGSFFHLRVLLQR